MAKLIITIDLNNSRRPSADELAQCGFENEVEYWIDYAYTDPPDVFHDATWDLFEECGETRQPREDWPARGPCDLRLGHDGMHHDVDKHGNGMWWT
jgi:hypothetical protein